MPLPRSKQILHALLLFLLWQRGWEVHTTGAEQNQTTATFLYTTPVSSFHSLLSSFIKALYFFSPCLGNCRCMYPPPPPPPLGLWELRTTTYERGEFPSGSGACGSSKCQGAERRAMTGLLLKKEGWERTTGEGGRGEHPARLSQTLMCVTPSWVPANKGKACRHHTHC